MTELSPALRPRYQAHGIPPWRWEEALDQLRRPVPDDLIDRHWRTTGNAALDACARAHLGEWLALDRGVVGGARACADDPDVVIALVGRALQRSFWDLYAVEGHGPGELWVRRLRDHRGFAVAWVEGRWAPPTGSTVALRLMRLEPPGLWASTLPLIFGDGDDAGEILGALLRSFGACGARDWGSFMRGVGARIAVEFALAHLEQSRLRPGATTDQSSTAAAREEAFRALELRVKRRPEIVGQAVNLATGGQAWLIGSDPGVELLLFDDPRDLARYRARCRDPRATDGLRRGWCRAGRAHDIEDSLGPVQLIRRDRHGVRHDPTSRDEAALKEACLKLSLATAQGRRAA